MREYHKSYRDSEVVVILLSETSFDIEHPGQVAFDSKALSSKIWKRNTRVKVD